MSEMSPNFNVDYRIIKIEAATKDISRAIKRILYVEQSPDYEEGSLEDFERIFGTSQECIDKYNEENNK